MSESELYPGGELRAATVPHQGVAHLLVRAFRSPARKAGLGAHGSVLLRAGAHRRLIPDLLVARVDRLAPFADAADTVLIGEVGPPVIDGHGAGVVAPHAAGEHSAGEVVSQVVAGNAGPSSRLERYAATGVPWFLLVQPETAEHRAVSLRLHHLEGGRYFERASAGPSQTLNCKEPFSFRIRAADLVIF